jgi:hypothetical protein
MALGNGLIMFFYCMMALMLCTQFIFTLAFTDPNKTPPTDVLLWFLSIVIGSGTLYFLIANYLVSI